MRDPLVIKRAESAAEFEQIHRLNYRTFAEELAQYTADGAGLLVDKFHDKNVYFVAVEQGCVIGMVAAHDQPPFSTAARLTDPAILDRLPGPLLEVRLLAFEPGSRHRMVFGRLTWQLYKYARERGYSHLIISGIAQRQKMYARLGFRSLGPAVVSGAAAYIPMALCLNRPPERLASSAERHRARESRFGQPPLLSLLPGPVEIAPPISQAFRARPISHRSPAFLDAYDRVRSRLSGLAGGMRPAILLGSGTTANDAAAQHLKAWMGDTPGLILVNGEFGERLAGLAARAGLKHRTRRWAWAQPWDFDQIEDDLRRGARWVWAVHLETSTGMLNHAARLLEITCRREVRVALDCVSSIGATPLPLDGVSLATGVSGKSIGSFAGLSFVFATAEALSQKSSVPAASLDIRAAIDCAGSQFTVPSPLILALDAALALDYATAEQSHARFRAYRELGATLRARLRDLQMPPIVSEKDAAPCIATFASPSPDFSGECRKLGFEVASDSAYLRERGWAQVGIMGAVQPCDVSRFAGALSRAR